jgi:hypothetical protein
LYAGWCTLLLKIGQTWLTKIRPTVSCYGIWSNKMSVCLKQNISSASLKIWIFVYIGSKQIHLCNRRLFTVIHSPNTGCITFREISHASMTSLVWRIMKFVPRLHILLVPSYSHPCIIVCILRTLALENVVQKPLSPEAEFAAPSALRCMLLRLLLCRIDLNLFASFCWLVTQRLGNVWTC